MIFENKVDIPCINRKILYIHLVLPYLTMLYFFILKNEIFLKIDITVLFEFITNSNKIDKL